MKKDTTYWIRVAVVGILCAFFSVSVVYAYEPFAKRLHVGSRGDSVVALQELLTAEGVYAGPITGYFGFLTRDGVQLLQAKYGLEPVGWVGRKTRKLLNALRESYLSENVPTEQIATTTASEKEATSTVAEIIPTENVSTSLPNTDTVQTAQPTRSSEQPLPEPVSTVESRLSKPSETALQWGMYPGDTTAASLESTLGKQMNIVATFTGWPDAFPTYLGTVCASDPNKSLLIFWENYRHSLDDIIAGTYDPYIDSFAKQTADYRCPVIISLFHEMNGNWDDWDGTLENNSPAKIIAAWHHIHDRFAAAGVTNVRWAWAVNNVSIPDIPGNQPEDYYPGDAYVDFVGVDGFNFGDPWMTFAQVFDTAISRVQKYHKPIYIFSTGSAPGSEKAEWITQGLGSCIKTYSNVKGWVWFNLNGGGANWLIDSDDASFAAFKKVIQ